MKNIVLTGILLAAFGSMAKADDYIVVGTQTVTIHSDFPAEKRQARRDFLASDIQSKMRFVAESQARISAVSQTIIDEQFELDQLGQVEQTVNQNKSDVTPPTDPANLGSGLSAQPLAVFLKWSDSTDDHAVAGYNIYQNGALVSFVTETGYADFKIQPKTSYKYGVEAVDSSGNKSQVVNIDVAVP